MITLMRVGWGRDNPIFRRMYTTEFVPDGDESLLRAYDELMRRTTSPENAARFEEAFSRLDVAEIASQVRVPALVMHLTEDRVVSFGAGRQLAAAIPGAQFVQLDGRNHVLRPSDPAWARFLELTERFAADLAAGEKGATATEPLSRRELEVLGLVTRGMSNQEIATELGLSVDRKSVV